MAKSRTRSRVAAAKTPTQESAPPDAGEAAVETPEATAAEAPGEEVVDAPVWLNRSRLLARVAETAGVRRRVARPVMEAVLKELGEALSRGEQLNLQPFGKAVVNRRRESEVADVLIVKLRRTKPVADDVPPPATDPLAEAAE